MSRWKYRFQNEEQTDRVLLSVWWVLIVLSVAVWVGAGRTGWDVAIYHSAMRSLAAGHDPYADATAIQRVFHSQRALHLGVEPPFSYVYSPITLPILRLAAAVPGWLSGGLYWMLYAVAVLGQLWVGLQATGGTERRYFLYLAPVSIFFPGLLADGTTMSGNIAFILYACIFAAAVYAWKGGSWMWFYAATLGASCIKAPLLSLVVIPVLSARRQRVPVCVTVLAGVALFAVQPLIWPTLFRNYLDAVELQFSFNRDFGCSPAGIFSGVLYDHGIPYAPASLVFYLCYALPLLGYLVYLSHGFLQGRFSLKQWMPVLFVGVILLNPRLLEYDVAPISLSLALIAWRFVGSRSTPVKTVPMAAILFVVANAFAVSSFDLRKLMDGPLLVLLFFAGSWNLLQQTRQSRPLVLESAAA